MKRWGTFGLFAVAMVFVVSGCGGGGGSDPITCQIAGMEEGTILSGRIQVTVEFTGPVTFVELIAGDKVVIDETVAAGAQSVVIEWNSIDHSDGEVELSAVGQDGLGGGSRSEGVRVVLDNASPVVATAVTFPRMSVVDGLANIPLDIIEANPTRIRVVHEEAGQEIWSSTNDFLAFDWDTGGVEDGIQHLMIEVTDVADHQTRLNHFPVVVANQGAEVAFEFVDLTQVEITENWMNEEYHVRATVPAEDNITRVIAWLTWEPSPGWVMTYDLGQGLCPHRGITYMSADSAAGEIVFDLKRSELEQYIVDRFPAADQDSATFPYNTDPFTFGAFFGHIAPDDPGSHVGETLPIDLHFVFFYEQ